MPSPIDREKRIRSSGEYRRVYDAGHKLAGRHLVLFYAASDAARVGITVSSKVGGAVERNRAKRRIKEALRQELPAASSARDMVFVAKKSIKAASFDDIKKDIRSLMGRVG